jgi:hypothetical protein
VIERQVLRVFVVTTILTAVAVANRVQPERR